MEESRIRIRIPPELHERLRVGAALKGKSINGLIVEILDQAPPQEGIKEMVDGRGKISRQAAGPIDLSVAVSPRPAQLFS